MDWQQIDAKANESKLKGIEKVSERTVCKGLLLLSLTPPPIKERRIDADVYFGNEMRCIEVSISFDAKEKTFYIAE